MIGFSVGIIINYTRICECLHCGGAVVVELRTVFGILLMSYNAVEVVVHLFAIPLYLMHGIVELGSQLICQAVFNMFMLSIMATESFAASCILFHITYLHHVPQLQVEIRNAQEFTLPLELLCVWLNYDICSDHNRI